MNRLELVGRIMSIGAEAKGKSTEAKKKAINKAITELNDYENAVKNCSIPDVSECVTWTTDEVLNIIEENEHLDDLRMFFTEHGR